MSTKTNRNRALVALSLAGLMLGTGLAVPASADDDRGPRYEQRGEDGAFRAGQRFARADSDGNRALSLEEFQAAGLERFTLADADGNGAITLEEIVAARAQAMQERMERRAERMLERLDADGDGVITLEEATERGEAEFARLDADGDGELEPREMRRGMRDGMQHRDGERGERHRQGG